MKKNISVISMDSVLQEWLLQKLIKEPPESDSAKELLSGEKIREGSQMILPAWGVKIIEE